MNGVANNKRGVLPRQSSSPMMKKTACAPLRSALDAAANITTSIIDAVIPPSNDNVAVPFVELNKDLWHNIASYLSAEDMFNLALTGKKFALLDIKSLLREQWAKECEKYVFLGFRCRGGSCRFGVDYCGLPHAEIRGIDFLENEEDQTEFETLPLDELRGLGSNDDDNSSQGDCSCYGMTSSEIGAREREFEELEHAIGWGWGPDF